jgi:hypothetical protein
MEKEEALQKKIIIYWWNMGSKKLDFQGTYKEWFEKNDIKCVALSSHLHFSGTFGNMKFTMKLGKNYQHAFNQIIKLCLMYLGDKALLYDGFNREHKINWR